MDSQTNRHMLKLALLNFNIHFAQYLHRWVGINNYVFCVVAIHVFMLYIPHEA